MLKYIFTLSIVVIFACANSSFANDKYKKIELPHGITLELPGSWQSKYEKGRKLNAEKPVVVLAAAKPDSSGNVLAWVKISAISTPNFFIPTDLSTLSQKEKDKIISDTRAIIGQGSSPGKNDIKNISVTIGNLNGFYCLKVTYLWSKNASMPQQNYTTMTFNRKDIGISIEAASINRSDQTLNAELDEILSTVVIGKK